MRVPVPVTHSNDVQSTGGIQMVAVEEKTGKKDSIRRSAQGSLPRTRSASDAGAKLVGDAEQQILELERTFTDRWEW